MSLCRFPESTETKMSVIGNRYKLEMSNTLRGINQWVFDNNCVKYYRDQTWKKRIMAQALVLDGSKELQSGHWFGYVCCDLTLEIRPWFKVMTHPWFIDNNCVKYCRSNMTGSNYGLDTDLSSACTVTLEIWPWVKVTSLVMHNDGVKYYPAQKWQ